MQWWQQPFFQVALPIIVTFILATWYQSGRITDLRDSMSKRLDDLRSDMNTRFAAIDRRLEKLEEKVEGFWSAAGASAPSTAAAADST